MTLLWEITYLAVLVYVVLLIPFAIFYYEADDGMGNMKEVRMGKAAA
jgi:LMBR1 domain-containing protein 1